MTPNQLIQQLKEQRDQHAPSTRKYQTLDREIRFWQRAIDEWQD